MKTETEIEGGKPEPLDLKIKRLAKEYRDANSCFVPDQQSEAMLENAFIDGWRAALQFINTQTATKP